MMFLYLDKTSEVKLYEQIYQKIKDSILEGRLTGNDKLPSKRQLKIDLGVSMTTIEHAYQQLVDEDLIYSRKKSGYFVTALDLLHVENKKMPEIIKPSEKKYNLPLGSIDTSIVQNDAIKQIAKEVFADDALLNQGPPSGEDELKEAISDYLHVNRGVSCSSDQIFIGPSTEYLLDQIFYLFKRPGITIEDPGYPMIKNVLRRLNLPFDTAEVERDGINVDRVQVLNNDIVHVTPSHQFPSGTVLSLNKRIQLLNYATAHNAYIIEDDYDSEFRYTGKPLSSLQGLDQSDRTIYMNTFSKSIYPSLRLAVMVLPKTLAEQYYKQSLPCNVPRQMQHVVARFITGGYIHRHINRMRKIYGKKMTDITQWLEAHYPNVEIHGKHTGMHFTLKIPGVDLSTTAAVHQLLTTNQYRAHSTLSDSVIVGIGQHSTQEIINILDVFLKDIPPK